MRMRVARIGIAVTLAAVAATVGLTGPPNAVPSVMRNVLRDVARVAAAPAYAAATVGLPGSAGVGSAHDRAPAADAALAPAVLLSFAVASWLLIVGARRRSSRAVAGDRSRGPPRSVVVTSPS